MKEIFLSGDIGWEITAQDLQSQIESVDEDLVIHINSRGGLAFEGVAIHNLIKNHKGNTTGIINGMAASAASFLYQAFDTRKVYDTSVEMHHNPLTIAMGDHNAMKKAALHLEKLAGSFAVAYAKATKRSKKDIQAELDAETYLYGQEIIDAGFADELIETSEAKDKDEMVLTAMMSMDALRDKMQKEPKLYNADLEKATKLFDYSPVNSGKNKILKQGGSKVMTREQLKAEHPELYNSIKQIGVDEAFKDVSNHLKMIDIDKDKAVENIKNQVSFMDCVSDYMATKIRGEKLDETVEESAIEVDPANESSDVENAEEAHSELMAMALNMSSHKGVK